MFLKVIEGKVTDWRGKFGFMSSDQMEGKIFLHRLAKFLGIVDPAGVKISVCYFVKNYSRFCFLVLN